MGMEQVLRNMVGKKVAVVMDDGKYFRGVVVEVSPKHITLKDVEETDEKEVEWEETEGGTYGIHIWHKVNLPEVYMNMSHVSRVWVWPSDQEGGVKYVYTRMPLPVI